MKKNVWYAVWFTALCLVIPCTALSAAGKQETLTLRLAAAASLKNVFEQKLIPDFEKKYSIKVSGIYDSSGRLQTQIEQGLDADIFMSAATTQMDALVKNGYITPTSVVPLLQNKLVLIKRKGTRSAVTSFETILNAKTIALGDPRTTPAGQYAQEAFTKMGNWRAIESSGKLSLGNNVTEVLSWVAAASGEVGIVYATDAASNKSVEVIAVLADDLLSKPVIYPVGRTVKTPHPEEASRFIEYLRSSDAEAAFKNYGFSLNK